MSWEFPCDLLAALDILIAERIEDYTFRPVVPPPQFCLQLFPPDESDSEVKLDFEECPFLAHFIEGAEAFWAGSCKGRLNSGPWIESGQDDTEYPLEASALCVAGRSFLVVELLGVDFQERRRLLQSARERHVLQHNNELLKREIERRTRIEKELAEREKELRLSNGFQKRLLATAATAIFTVDETGMVTSVNDEFTRLTGYEPEEVLGKSCLSFSHGPFRSKCGMFDDADVRPIIREQGTIRTSGGRLLTVFINASPLFQRNVVVGGIQSFVDVSDLIEARIEAEHASRAKTEFLANMSHDIRTPINGIIAMTELALNTNLTEEQFHYLNSVQQSADNLLELIDDILDFSRIEAGRLPLVESPFELRSWLANALGPISVQADRKGLELSYEIPDNVPERLVGDPGRLRQVLINLAGNAVKFTEEGEITVGVRSESTEGDRVSLQFSVADTGVGVASRDRDRIFHAFEQADAIPAQRYGGTGLGLAVSSQLVRLMGGRIWLESEMGKGSVFHFKVPLRVQVESEQVALSADTSDLIDISALVIHDDPIMRHGLQELLSRWGMKPTVAGSGADALVSMDAALGEGTPFRLVLVDHQMAERQEFDLTRSIRRHPSGGESVAIVLIGVPDSCEAPDCEEFGIAAHLPKPIDKSDLLGTIFQVLFPSVPGDDRRPLEPGRLIKRSERSLDILLVEDNPINREAASTVLRKMGYSVWVAEDGREALATLDDRDFDLILMDVLMPAMDGIETTKAIREREEATGEHIPIVAITAYAMKGDRQRFLDAGMDDYVSKPMKSRDLQAAIDRVLSKEESGKTRRPPSPEGVGTDRIFAKELFLEKFGDTPEFVPQLVNLFLQRSAAVLLEIRKAIDSGTPEDIHRWAHSLKGEAGELSAPRVAEVAARLEAAGRGEDLSQVAQLFGELEKEMDRLKRELHALLGELK
ncbi:response regulator [Thermodesulfobacteriota bacterium]